MRVRLYAGRHLVFYSIAFSVRRRRWREGGVSMASVINGKSLARDRGSKVNLGGGAVQTEAIARSGIRPDGRSDAGMEWAGVRSPGHSTFAGRVAACGAEPAVQP